MAGTAWMAHALQAHDMPDVETTGSTSERSGDEGGHEGQADIVQQEMLAAVSSGEAAEVLR